MKQQRKKAKKAKKVVACDGFENCAAMKPVLNFLAMKQEAAASVNDDAYAGWCHWLTLDLIKHLNSAH